MPCNSEYSAEPGQTTGLRSAIPAVAFAGIATGAAGLVILPFLLLAGLGGTSYGRVSWADLAMPVTGLVGFLFSLLLFVGSIGAFYRRRWPPPLLITYSIAVIAITLIGGAIYGLWALPHHNSDHPTFRGTETLGAVVVIAIGFAMAVAFMSLLTRPHVRGEFIR